MSEVEKKQIINNDCREIDYIPVDGVRGKYKTESDVVRYFIYRNNWYADVLDFHEKFDCYIGDNPKVPSKNIKALRISIMDEEFDEMITGILEDDLEKIADGAIDTIYVILGTLISYGIDPEPIWNEIQKTNMAKEGGGKREDGKIHKPHDWDPPKVRELLEEQGAEFNE